MSTFPVTITFIALYSIVLIPIAGWIGTYRSSINALRGDGGDPILFKRIRIHANLTENAPVMALALGASEMLGMTQWILWLAVCSFLIGRISHYKLYDCQMRAFAMLLTQLSAALLGVWCLYTLYIG
jgi:uncharacterized membrane protein YecN with MAPEG domain